MVPNPQKEREVEALRELLSSNNVQFVTDHSGLSVKEISNLRGRLRECGASMRISKNRLINIARDQAGLVSIESILEGPSSVIFASEDPVTPAKILRDFIKEFEKPAIKTLVIDNVVWKVSKFDELASLPSIDELRAKMVGRIAAPITGLVFTMSGLLRGFVVALNAVAEKKQQAA